MNRCFAIGTALGLMVLQCVCAPWAAAGVSDEACPAGAINVEAGTSIQAAVERAGRDATFCLKNGIHRLQVIRPESGQKFYGEGHSILNGSRQLATFIREGGLWIASGQRQRGKSSGRCLARAPTCDLPEVVFIDDQPLVQIRSKRDLASGRFYLDRKAGNLYLKDDPTGRKVEITVAAIAFESEASNILIKNLTVEKYASVAQIGAINGQRATGWSIENCEVRLNSSAGISLGADGRVRVCNIHHNGQLGVGGVGHNILLEQNEVWANNTRGFSYRWEAGGVKIALSDGVVFRDNHVHDNVGPGLWCDINCRDVLYENNTVERNSGTGIFHEISFKATIRNNIVRNNGLADDWQWVWGNDILIAASQDVDVHDNTVVVSPGKCGIVMIDQSRPIEGPMKGGGKYKTRNNRVHDNNITFLGAPCAGGASDVMPGDENYSIISSGNNVFDRNVYRVPSPIDQPWFFWEHSMLDWDSLKLKGLERDGRFEVY